MRTKKKNVMRTPEEKEAIVLEYLNDKHPSYRKTADKYGIAGSTFKKWKKAYLEFGIKGLKSQTGKTKHPGKGNHLAGLQLKKNKKLLIKLADRLFEKKNLKSFEVLNIINSKGFICA